MWNINGSPVRLHTVSIMAHISLEDGREYRMQECQIIVSCCMLLREKRCFLELKEWSLDVEKVLWIYLQLWRKPLYSGIHVCCVGDKTWMFSVGSLFVYLHISSLKLLCLKQFDGFWQILYYISWYKSYSSCSLYWTQTHLISVLLSWTAKCVT